MSLAAAFMLMDFKLMEGEADLHTFLRCSTALANQLLHEPDASLFIRHLIPKTGGRGGTREVWEVRTDRLGDLYKGLARRLDEFIRCSLPGFPHAAVHGYVAGRSTWTNANAHVGSTRVLKGDIKSFFRSVSRERVVALLGRLGLSEGGAAALATVVVREDHVPLGLHTSPLLANAVCHALDHRLAVLVPGGCYTRYADDLSFSGPALPTRGAVEAELKVDGFELASDKWRLARAGRGLYVTGLSIEDRRCPRVPKDMKRRLRQDIHHAEQRGLEHHVGRRGHGTIQSGINRIDGLIRYVRGIEPALGLAHHAKWVEILRRAGRQISYPAHGEIAPRDVLFLLDESEVTGPLGWNVLMLALVVVEDLDLIRTDLNTFLNKLAHDPDGATEKADLSKKGLHWNHLAPDDRTDATKRIQALPFRCFVATGTLNDSSKKTYRALYDRLLTKLLEGRLVRYDRCAIELVAEENGKIRAADVSTAVATAYGALARAGSRRPAAAPKSRVAPKGSEPALPLPDLILGILGEYADSEAKADREVGEKKKRPTGAQAHRRFDLVRDKIRAIFDLDSGQVFSRRKPFRPWRPPGPETALRDDIVALGPAP